MLPPLCGNISAQDLKLQPVVAENPSSNTSIERALMIRGDTTDEKACRLFQREECAASPLLSRAGVVQGSTLATERIAAVGTIILVGRV